MLCTECKNVIPSVPNHTSPIAVSITVAQPQVLKFVFFLDQDLTATRWKKNDGSVSDWSKQNTFFCVSVQLI